MAGTAVHAGPGLRGDAGPVDGVGDVLVSWRVRGGDDEPAADEDGLGGGQGSEDGGIKALRGRGKDAVDRYVM
jgi:hypothetical protein